MSVDKRAQRIKQTPKHLEKMLFVNHKEEQGLQRRLEDITMDSRVKGRLLDMERIKVRNECRFVSRLNYQHIAPLLDRLPALIQREMTKHGYTVESVNDYLLREYRRNSRVIPSILSSVGKDQQQQDNDEPEMTTQTLKDAPKNNMAVATTRKQNVVAASAAAASASPDSRRKSVVIRQQPSSSATNNGYYNTNSDNSLSQSRKLYNTTGDDGRYTTPPNKDDNTDDINPRRISTLVKEIAKIRNDMNANKKIDIMRSKVTFPDLLRNVQEKDKQGSDSGTFTDGTCVLLRRKMQKIRKHAAPDPDLEVCALLGQGHPSGNGQAPKKRHSVAQSTFQSKVPRLPAVATKTSKSATTMSSIARQSILENDEKELRRQLDEQERQQKDLKVAIEIRKYNKIQQRVDDFLRKTPKRPAIPVLYETEIG